MVGRLRSDTAFGALIDLMLARIIFGVSRRYSVSVLAGACANPTDPIALQEWPAYNPLERSFRASQAKAGRKQPLGNFRPRR
jgi:hypothetical protein